MSSTAAFRLGALTVDPNRDEVSGPGGKVHLEPRVMDLVVYLAQRPDEVVTREELIEAVWQGYPGADQSLSNTASKLRQALEEAGGDREQLQTVPKRGYSLVGPVEPVAPARRRTIVAITTGLALAMLATFLLVEQPFRWGRPVEESSVAVLPFENLSPDPNQQYFADGVAEELLNVLAQVKGLKVSARTSSFLFDEPNADVAEVGRALNVANVVEGSVRRDGNRIRVTVQLIDADEGYHRWSRTFDRELSDIFEIQDQIARAVVDALKVELLKSPKQKLARRSTDSIEAYDLYLAGRQRFNQRGQGNDEARRAIDLFEQAVEVDPEFALAWSGIADYYSVSNDWWLETYMDRDAIAARALEAARRAVELEPKLAEAQASLGMALGKFEDDYEQGRVHLRKAIELNPGYATALHWLGTDYFHEGWHSEALRLQERAATLDPLNNIVITWYARTLGTTGRYEKAVTELERVLEYTPEADQIHDFLFHEAFESGRFVEAHDRLENWLALYEGPNKDGEEKCCGQTALYQRARLEVALGRFDAAQASLSTLREIAPEAEILYGGGRYWLLNGEGRYPELQKISKGPLAIDLPTGLRNIALNFHGRANLLTGDVDAAIESLEQPENWGEWRGKSETRCLLAYAYLQAGRPGSARDLADQTLALLEETESHGNRRPVLYFRKAMLLAMLDRREEALEALDEAYQSGWRHYHAVTVRPFLDELMGDDERYAELIQRVRADIDGMRLAVESEKLMTKAKTSTDQAH